MEKRYQAPRFHRSVRHQMNRDLDFHWAEPQDLVPYERFLQETYGPQAIQTVPGRARWLFWDNPLGCHVTLCRYRGRIIGACGNLPYPVKLRESAKPSAFGIDMMVAPEMRRHGIAKQLFLMRQERFALSLSTGQSDGMMALYGKLSPLDLGATHSGLWCNAIQRTLSSRDLARDFVSWFRPRLRNSASVTCQRSELSSKDAAIVAGELRSGREDQMRSSDWYTWFGWRYASSLYDDYLFWHLRTECGIEGILVSRIEGKTEHLVDLYSAPAHRIPLLAAAGASSRIRASILVSGSDLVADVVTAGFFARRLTSRLLAVEFANNRVDAKALRRLNLWAGASDIDLLRLPPSTCFD